MPDNVCKHCGCNEIDEDPARGDKVCTNCGSVLEEQLIVSEIQFQENAAGGASVMGQFVSLEGAKSYTLGGTFTHGIGRDSRTVTLQNAKRKIQEVGGQLRLNPHYLDVAHNFFKMALDKNLTRGRKSLHVVATCLYIVCRMEGTSHMLLDLSDILQVNVYTLGRTFLHICQALCLNIPAVDPCLYIDRFAGRLQFGDKNKDVCSTALRLVQRMKRDWIHTGRRPSGLCGAALLVAARMHDFNRTVKEVIKVVKVCESTVRKRLTEFEDTPSSQLTIEEFHNIDLEEAQDPPCFTEGKKRSKMAQLEEQDPKLNSHLQEVESLQEEIEKSLVPKKPCGIYAAYAKMAGEDTSTSKSTEVAAVTSFLEKETLKDVMTDTERESLSLPTIQVTEPGAEESARNIKKEERELMEKGMRVPSLAPTTASLGIKSMVEDCIIESEKPGEEEEGGELDLEGINDEELDALLLTEDEVKLKTEIWMKENEDYLKAQKEKEERRIKEELEQGSKPEKKKKRYKRRNTAFVEAASATEALAMVIQEKKLSNKINYKVLDNLKAIQTSVSQLAASRAGGEASMKMNVSSPGPSILKAEPVLNRFKKPSLLSDEPEPPAKKKRVQIQDPVQQRVETQAAEVSSTPHVLVETGPVQYEPEPEPEVEEEEEEEEEEGHISAQKLFGREVSAYEDESDYDLL
ncbi:transcription factor IIIB 90 kDa subunit-like [Littorina saxatilis]|uniref:transcription factor IIIB 90 kDa subunit-like n=1 Tax=Littorina saxatilis TaxID=31220 RepID=UPI0038B5A725